MSTTLTREDVTRIAELARLELTPEELDLFTRQLGDILGYVEQIRRSRHFRCHPDLARPQPARRARRRDRRTAAARGGAVQRARRGHRGRPLQSAASSLMSTPIEQSARAIARDIAAGRVKATEVCDAFLARIREEEPRIGAFNTVIHERAMTEARAVDASRANGAERSRCSACRSRSRTTCARPACRPPLRLGCCAGSCLPIRRPWSRVLKPPARLSSARPTSTSSPWDRRPRTRRTARLAIHGTSPARQAAAVADPPPRWPRRWSRCRLVRIPVVRFASPPRFAGSSA